MDPRLLKYYNAELQHFREMSGEFAAEFPKVAGRLGLDSFECADPYVERLIEGFAFLAARVRLKVDAEFPRFTRHMLQLAYPHYLAPTPSMAVVRFQPTLTEGSLAEGFAVPRGSVMKTLLGKGEQTPCEYRTAHDVVLWPLELADAEYIGSTAAVSALGVTELQGVRAAIRLRLKAAGGLTFDKLALDALPLYLRGSNELPVQIYEQLIANVIGMGIVRDKVGSFKERVDMQRWLQDWIMQYVDGDPANSSEETKARKPLAAAEVVVEEVEGNPGYYSSKFYLRPHYQLEGLTVSLRLVSKLPSAKAA